MIQEEEIAQVSRFWMMVCTAFVLIYASQMVEDAFVTNHYYTAFIGHEKLTSSNWSIFKAKTLWKSLTYWTDFVEAW